ncbi:hypothetical protein NLI96_g5730 [Meripilus lineatus]|uniref:ribonuclease T2 n=1 Tax=Meripilus lineatus TaxID=2056292 RepID=A0AAD5V2E3_9APHY|nr:hypothetical protein NLI96_g5730 [Physisporinus lineatus]
MYSYTLLLGFATLSVATPTISSSIAHSKNLLWQASSCEAGGQVSCRNTTRQSDLCCFEHPGGLLLQTQFWDTQPVTGPSDSWTIHGLWPDNCDGSFDQNCDSSRNYRNLDKLLSSQGAEDVLEFMNEYWVDLDGRNEKFWEHEWSKHGTCYSTLQPSCLPEGSPKGAERSCATVPGMLFSFELTGMVDANNQLRQALPTYQWLADAGITPSSKKTYTLSEITNALRSASGVTPALACHGKTLNQISWYFNLKGSLIDGEFMPINTPKKGNCASSGLKYPPKVNARKVTTGGDSSFLTGASDLVLQATSYLYELFLV